MSKHTKSNLQHFPFGLTLLKPKGKLAVHVQALWSLTVDVGDSSQIDKWLQGDACSGILFNLGAPVFLDGQTFGREMIYLPVSKKSHVIKLDEATRIAGIRFQQGVAALLFGPAPKQASVLAESQQQRAISMLAADLLQTTNHYHQLRKMYQWLLIQTASSRNLPTGFLEAVSILNTTQSLKLLTSKASMSQRQIERHYRKWLDMTPNQYLRLIRVNSALQEIKLNPQTNLVALALLSGFSDQAHMTREFKEIAGITPFKYAKLSQYN